MTNTINFEDIKLTDAERQPCEIWTRVMGKKSEYYTRKCFVEEKAIMHMDLGESCGCTLAAAE